MLTTNEKTPVVVSNKANPATNQHTLDGVAYNTITQVWCPSLSHTFCMTNISDPNYPLTDPVEVTVITNGPDTSPVLTINEKTPVVVSTKANPATNPTNT